MLGSQKMKPETTLEKLLKPPFVHDKVGMVYDGNTRLTDIPGLAFEGEDKNDTHLARVRGWGFFQYYKNGEKLQDEFMDFLTAALNEKWERDFREPDENVDCFDCRHYFVDEKDLDRCKLKGNSVTVDPDVKEPCNGFEHKNIEPPRWVKVDFPERPGYQCPKCEHIGWKNYNYCPMCGQKLYPPDTEYSTSETIDSIKLGIITSKDWVKE